MRRILILYLTTLSLASCERPTRIENVAINYIKYLNNEIEHNGNYNIFITEIKNKDKTIYRLSASNNNIERDNLPFKYFKYKEKYIFIFNSSKYTTIALENELEKEGLFEEHHLFFILDNYPEWILITCDNEKYTLIKNSWYKPIEEINEINNFQCN